MILPSAMPLMVSALVSIPAAIEANALPGTEPLTMEGDIASQLVLGVGKFLLRELAASVERRANTVTEIFRQEVEVLAK